jgi:hypothetical protein
MFSAIPANTVASLTNQQSATNVFSVNVHAAAIPPPSPDHPHVAELTVAANVVFHSSGDAASLMLLPSRLLYALHMND